jgi:hypothetical protein
VLTESDRTQVLDAVIDYGGELLVVVENKIAEDDDLQARELNTTGARVRLADGQEAVVVLGGTCSRPSSRYANARSWPEPKLCCSTTS